MEQGKKMSIIVSIVIFLAVIAVFVFISIKGRQEEPVNPSVAEGEMENMATQTQQEKGVKMTIVEEGSGEAAQPGDMVTVNYTGKLADGTVFDSNIDPKFGHVEPFSFTLGAGMVIQGWESGVAGMTKGEKRILEIAPEYAYGPSGIGGVIPGNATLVFEVELLEITK